MPMLKSVGSRLVPEGALTLIGPRGRSYRFASGRAGPEVAVRIHDRALIPKLLAHPSVALGEAYMDGTLTIESGSLYELLELCIVATSAYPAILPRLLSDDLLSSIALRIRSNPVFRARRHAAHHYDLSDALFDLFLDADRQYSCAYFPEPDMNLEQAQTAKKDLIAAKLLLEDGQRVLDIGSGWGGLALHLARVADIEVTGVTLSQRQLEVARQRASDAGLADRVHFELRDYRELTRPFDRIVSVGMFEHVGARHYAQFFDKVRRLLAGGGVALLHSIGRAEPPRALDPWLRKYIFPGAHIPALSEVMPPVERAGLWPTDIEILRVHYAETLRRWRERFQARRGEIVRVYDERFCRMWEFYLISSELAFRVGRMMVFQLQLANRRDAVPLTRDYLLGAGHAGRASQPRAA